MRRSMRVAVALLLCLLCAHESSAAAMTTVDAIASSTTVHVGEPVTVVITAEVPEHHRVRLDMDGTQVGTYRIETQSHTQSPAAPGFATHHLQLLLRSFDVADVTIPSMTVMTTAPDGAITRVMTDPIPMTISSLLPEDWSAADIQDIKSPRPLHRGLPWFWWLIGCCAVAGAVYIYRHMIVRLAQPVVAPSVPPYVRALRDLEALRAAQLVEQQDFATYYVQLTDIVRTYIEARFAVHAPDMTTEEFLRAATSTAQLRAAHQTLLHDFLEHGDMVKFARYQPSTDEAVAAWDAAAQFVRDTRPREQVIAQPLQGVGEGST